MTPARPDGLRVHCSNGSKRLPAGRHRAMRNETIRRITAVAAGAGLIATGLLAGAHARSGNDSGSRAIQGSVIDAAQVQHVAPGESDAGHTAWRFTLHVPVA